MGGCTDNGMRRSGSGTRLDQILKATGETYKVITSSSYKRALDSVNDDDIISRKTQFATYNKRRLEIRNDNVNICRECLCVLKPPNFGDYVHVCDNCGVQNAILPSSEVEERRSFLSSEKGDDADHRRTEEYNREHDHDLAVLEERFANHPHLRWAQTRLSHCFKICKILKDIEGQQGMPLILIGDVRRVAGITRLMVMEVLTNWDKYMDSNHEGAIKYTLGSHVLWTLTLLRQAFAERSDYMCPTEAIASMWDMDWIHNRLLMETSDRFTTDEHLSNATRVGSNSGVSSVHGTNNNNKRRSLRIDPLPESRGDRMKVIQKMNLVFVAVNISGFHPGVMKAILPTVDPNYKNKRVCWDSRHSVK